MRLAQARTWQLCRLLVATWALVFVFGMLLVCQGQAQKTHDLATPDTLQVLQLTAMAHAGTHDNPSQCEQVCQTLSSPVVKGEASIAIASLLIVWFLLPPLLLFSSASIPRLYSPASPGGAPPRPHLPFLRLNN